jgi:hypothetical protein
MAVKPKFGGTAKAFRVGPTTRPDRMRWSDPKTLSFRKSEKAKRKGGKGGGS